jgi:hypothetical protein
MSTHWDVCCVDCKSDLGLHGNHQEAAANSIARDAARLATVPGLVVDAEATYDFYGECGKTFRTDWFVTHAGHQVVARNEYGAISGRCSAYVACAACNATGTCNLLPGHDGPCFPFRNS